MNPNTMIGNGPHTCLTHPVYILQMTSQSIADDVTAVSYEAIIVTNIFNSLEIYCI